MVGWPAVFGKQISGGNNVSSLPRSLISVWQNWTDKKTYFTFNGISTWENISSELLYPKIILFCTSLDKTHTFNCVAFIPHERQ